MKSCKERKIEFDYLRTLAIALVVLCHAIQSINYLNLDKWVSYSIGTRIVYVTLVTFSRMGVPLFLFLTGALILKKEFNSNKDCYNFYKKNLIPIVIVTEIWIVIYNIFLIVKNNLDVGSSMKIVLKNMLFIENVNMPNMWYMPMIIGIYIVVPFLSKIVHTFEKKILFIPITISIIISIIIPSINVMLRIFGKNTCLNLCISREFLGGLYGIFVILGWYLSEGCLKHIKSRYILLSGIFGTFVTSLNQFILFNKGIRYDLWYSYIFLVIASVCVFEGISRIKFNRSKKINSIIVNISKLSFGIFLIHIVVQQVIAGYIKKMNINDMILVSILAMCVFLLSYIIAIIISKIKYIRKYIILLKE